MSGFFLRKGGDGVLLRSFSLASRFFLRKEVSWYLFAYSAHLDLLSNLKTPWQKTEPSRTRHPGIMSSPAGGHPERHTSSSSNKSGYSSRASCQQIRTYAFFWSKIRLSGDNGRRNWITAADPFFICGAADRSGRGKPCSSCCCWGREQFFIFSCTVFFGVKRKNFVSKGVWKGKNFVSKGVWKDKNFFPKGCEKAKTLYIMVPWFDKNTMFHAADQWKDPFLVFSFSCSKRKGEGVGHTWEMASGSVRPQPGRRRQKYAMFLRAWEEKKGSSNRNPLQKRK